MIWLIPLFHQCVAFYFLCGWLGHHTSVCSVRNVYPQKVKFFTYSCDWRHLDEFAVMQPSPHRHPRYTRHHSHPSVPATDWVQLCSCSHATPSSSSGAEYIVRAVCSLWQISRCTKVKPPASYTWGTEWATVGDITSKLCLIGGRTGIQARSSAPSRSKCP